MGKITENITAYFLRLHAEDYGHLISTCGELTAAQLWHPVPGGVPVANILCHVAEMESFWIDWGLCGVPYGRDRQLEFDRKDNLTPKALKDRLITRRDKTVKAVTDLPDPLWTEEREFHNDTHTGLTIITWHLRHLGLHRGHVQAHARWILNGASS